MGSKPTVKLDYELIRKLAAVQCTDCEIAAIVGISDDTFQRRKQDTPEMQAALKAGKESGRASLRRKQWAVAMGDDDKKPDPAMLIFLGKNYLQQSDKHEYSGQVDAPMKFVVIEPAKKTQEYREELIKLKKKQGNA